MGPIMGTLMGRGGGVHSDVRSPTQIVVIRSSWKMGKIIMGVISWPSLISSQIASATCVVAFLYKKFALSAF